ncbi:Gfo/Idh/MocA family protein [Domibacillus iocasae]|uniref:Oxidoreductase n=1 Tax=Domibacillus iocasae TaxID=1714016 RepID=A0A1E7DUC1_9BACI|nr:Gfo/Idh/MocA family oxidoreductase [Domibacillus iocasae]OES46687.1 oxidoreductase [Domibacillus iocasae]
MNYYKAVVVGCGGMANTWIDYIEAREDADIIALVDVNAEAAQSMAERRRLNVPCYTDLSEALADTGGNLVIDVTIPAAHKQVVTTALKSGYHVMGEKPLAETLQDGKEVVQTAEKTGKNYSVMQNRRYTKHIRTLQQLLIENKIGQVGSIHADFFIGPHFGGFREKMDSPLLIDMSIHTFDQARFLTGADAVSVYCHEYNPPGSWYEGNASAVCIFEMSNGSIFSYRGSWCAEGHKTSWDADWRITGTNGSAIWDGEGPPVFEIKDPSKPSEFIHPVRTETAGTLWTGQEGHAGCLDEMFAALKENRLAETDCRDNIKSMEMVFGALESVKTGKKVTLSL